MQLSFSIILPIKNLNQSKTRLRHSLSNQNIKDLTLNLMNKTINVALEAEIKNIFILSSDKTIKSQLIDKKATFVYQKEGDLNKAVKNGFDLSFSKEHTPIFLPCDLPLINKANILNIKTIMNNKFDVCIAPSESDFGTNCLAWSYKKKNLFHGFLGKYSYNRYKDFFFKNRLKYFSLDNPELAFDLDTSENLAYFKKTHNELYKHLLKTH